MKRIFALAVFAILSISMPARAGIEYLLQFSDDLSAQGDTYVGAFWTAPYFRRGRPQPGFWANNVLPYQQIWHPSQNNGDGTTNLLSGFWIVVTQTGNDATLDAHPNLKVKWDDTVKGPPPLANPAGFDMGDTDMQPVWSGSTGPFANSP